ncbi:MAG: hypothetical protein AB1668_03390 [Nanoarchaeota archaeon]
MLEKIIRRVMYLGMVSLTSLVSGGCGEPYGCFDDENCVDKGSYYECTLSGRFYGHPAGVNVSAGQLVEGQASGLVNWWEDKSGYENGPDNVPGRTRGLYLGIGNDPSYNHEEIYSKEYAGSSFSIEAPVSGQIYFLIPDGPGDGFSCTGEGIYWSDNGGEFVVEFKK